MTMTAPSRPSTLARAFGKARHTVPAHLKPTRPDPTAPNGLRMSRELSALQGEITREFAELRMEFDAKSREMQAAHEERMNAIVNLSAQQEARTEVSGRALQEAIAGTRNDEESRMLRSENERQHQTILALQAELAHLRGEAGAAVGYDKARYFLMLGEQVGEFATDLQDAGERLGEMCEGKSYDHGFLKALASKLTTMGEDLGEFGENALSYSEDAVLAQAAD